MVTNVFIRSDRIGFIFSLMSDRYFAWKDTDEELWYLFSNAVYYLMQNDVEPSKEGRTVMLREDEVAFIKNLLQKELPR